MMVDRQLVELQDLARHLDDMRAPRLSEWRELHEYIVPHRGLFPEESDTQTARLETRDIVNPAAQIALRRGAAGLTSAMTPSGMTWFRLGFIDDIIAETFPAARQWLDVVERKLAATLARGGWYQALHEGNQEYIGYGGMLLYLETVVTRDHSGALRNGVRCECCTVGTWSIGLDSAKEVDAVARVLRYTANQLRDKFGEDALSRDVKEMLKKRPYERVDVIHLVRRNPNWNPRRMDAASMPWASYFFEAKGAERLLKTGGYLDMPYLYAVWNDARGVYGTGPGDEALADARMVQSMETKGLVGLDKSIEPPMRKPVGFRGRLETYPGAQTPMSAYEKDAVAPLYTVNFIPGIQAVEGKVAQVIRRIDETLLASLFADLMRDGLTKDVTAYAIMARRQQMAQLMGPALASYEPNVLSKGIMRVLTLLDAAGELPPPPSPLDRIITSPRDLVNIEYISPLALALRSSGAETTQAIVANVAEMARINPEVVDKIDLDQAVDEISRGLGAPGGVVRSDAEVATIRQARAERQQKMMEQEAQARAAELAMRAGAMRTEGTLAGDLKAALAGQAEGGGNG
ncbi:hypothetical protein DA2_3795 [Desulfovibrio sp. A2]|nr:hypothetical protein DA2_3795 [Desulfovibrio sp. A2]